MGQTRGIAPCSRAVFFDREFDRYCNARSPGPIISLVQSRSSWSRHRLGRYFFFADFAAGADCFGASCEGTWTLSTLRSNTVNEARACAPASLSGLTTTALVFAMPNLTTMGLCCEVAGVLERAAAAGSPRFIVKGGVALELLLAEYDAVAHLDRAFGNPFGQERRSSVPR